MYRLPSYSFLICFLSRPISISCFRSSLIKVATRGTGSSTADTNEAWAARKAGGTRIPNHRIESVETFSPADLASSSDFSFWASAPSDCSGLSPAVPTGASEARAERVFSEAAVPSTSGLGTSGVGPETENRKMSCFAVTELNWSADSEDTETWPMARDTQQFSNRNDQRLRREMKRGKSNAIGVIRKSNQHPHFSLSLHPLVVVVLPESRTRAVAKVCLSKREVALCNG